MERTLLNSPLAGSRLGANQLTSDLVTIWPVTPWGRGKDGDTKGKGEEQN